MYTFNWTEEHERSTLTRQLRFCSRIATDITSSYIYREVTKLRPLTLVLPQILREYGGVVLYAFACLDTIMHLFNFLIAV